MTKKEKKILIVLICILIVMGLIIYLFNRADKLKGSWDIDGYTEYVFDGKGTGKLVVPLKEYAFKYSIKKDKLYIDFINKESTDAEYTFSIKSDVLEITNTKDDSLKFKLHKK